MTPPLAAGYLKTARDEGCAASGGKSDPMRLKTSSGFLRARSYRHSTQRVFDKRSPPIGIARAKEIAKRRPAIAPRPY
jgi:hypothetical protein